MRHDNREIKTAKPNSDDVDVAVHHPFPPLNDNHMASHIQASPLPTGISAVVRSTLVQSPLVEELQSVQRNGLTHRSIYERLVELLNASRHADVVDDPLLVVRVHHEG
jgi:hypothetical protein